jgi:sugar phosphate isomerase/epimerase
MPVYVSTSGLSNGDNVFKILDAYAKAGLKNVELGSNHKYIPNLSPADFRRYGFNLLCHHYFPPPRDPLIINLASQNQDILKKSREQVKKSIDFCASLGIGLLSFHAGFRADPDEMETFVFQGKPAAPYERAMTTFIKSIEEINGYAEKKNVRIAVENNVLAGYNMVEGQNPYLILCQAEEFINFFAEITSPNVGILLDLGHLNVTANSLGFDRYEFIRRVKDRVFALHIHENNGVVDEHKEISETGWCLDIIRDFADFPVVIESVNQSVAQIVSQVALLEDILRG